MSAEPPGQLTSVTSVADAIARMEAIQAATPAGDGLACFNRMYLQVTRQVNGELGQQFFADPGFMTRLDVAFANLYFGAVDAAGTVNVSGVSGESGTAGGAGGAEVAGATDAADWADAAGAAELAGAVDAADAVGRVDAAGAAGAVDGAGAAGMAGAPGAVTRPAAVPLAWRPLIERRADSGIEPIQFALAGMNAHINHDLPLAVVSTCTDLGTWPTAGTHLADYQKVDRLLDAAEQSARQSFESAPELAVDRHLQVVGNLVASWSINSARDLAWQNALLLWALRDEPVARGLFLDGLAAQVALASRLLLVAA
jgi:hypothetical protein